VLEDTTGFLLIGNIPQWVRSSQISLEWAYGIGIREVTELIRWVQYASEGQTAAVVR